MEVTKDGRNEKSVLTRKNCPSPIWATTKTAQKGSPKETLSISIKAISISIQRNTWLCEPYDAKASFAWEEVIDVCASAHVHLGSVAVLVVVPKRDQAGAFAGAFFERKNATSPIRMIMRTAYKKKVSKRRPFSLNLSYFYFNSEKYLIVRTICEV